MAARKSAGKSKSAKTKSSAAKKSTAKKSVKPDEVRETRRFWSYILFFIGIFELLLTFVPGDGMWQNLHLFTRGLFGWCSFLLGPMFIYVALMIASDIEHNTVVAKIIEGSIIMLLFCAIAQVLFVGKVSGEGFWDKLVGLYKSGTNLKGGGLASALLGWPMLAIFKRVGGSIILLLITFLFIMLLTNITLPQLLIGISAPFVKGARAVNRDRMEHAARESADRQEFLRKRRENFRVDIAKYYPDDDEMENAEPELFLPIFDDEENKDNKKKKSGRAKNDDEDNDDIIVDNLEPMPMHPVKTPVITQDKLEQTAKNTDNQELKNIIRKAVDKSENDKNKKTDKNSGKVSEPTFVHDHDEIKEYIYPPVDILKYSKNASDPNVVQKEIEEKSKRLVETLDTYGAKTRIVGIYRGPSVTRYELQPAAGVRVSKITGLSDDIALSLAALSVRIEAPVPGKAAIGIEVPNDHRDTVSLRELIDSKEYRASKGKLTFAVGKDIEGHIVIGDIAKMPHMLVAGTTGSGKSVFTNSIILSILYHATPDEVKLILIDPKKVEFPIYNQIPHLLIPVVTEPLKAAGALGWAVNEMNKRYLMFEANNVKNLQEFNDMVLEEHRKPEEQQDEMKMKLDLLPQIVIVVDEFADLMMAAKSEVEDSVLRLAQLARAAGIHMIIATQSPRADVLTGLIKSNIPSRVSLSVSSNVDSRVILDESGADKLLGNGDLLYKPVGVKKPIRVQSGYASTPEIRAVVEFLKNEHTAEYSEEIIHEVEQNIPQPKDSKGGDENISINPDDDLINQAISIIVQTGNASTAFLQRKLKLGFPRAARIMDEIEEMGIIGPSEGSKPRKINITEQEWIEMQARSN